MGFFDWVRRLFGRAPERRPAVPVAAPVARESTPPKAREQIPQGARGDVAPSREQMLPEPVATEAPAAVGVSPFAPGTGPARLIVLRHAEKLGDKRDPHLSLAGRRRAEWLADYIPATFGTPDFLVAARTSGRSRRPVETLEPLAQTLGLEIRAKLDDDESADLVAMLRDKQRFRGKLGIICWRHSSLPCLVAALGAPPGSHPEPWDESDYTTIVEVTYPGNGQVRARRLSMPR